MKELIIQENFVCGAFASNVLKQAIGKYTDLIFAIIDIDGLGREDTCPLDVIQENEINAHPEPMIVDYPYLINLLESFNDMIDICIIGDTDAANIKKYKDENEMRESCFLTIMLFDSTCWEISCKDESIIDSLSEHFSELI